MTEEKEHIETKENFCAQCVAIPLALAGTAGISAFGGKGLNFRKMKDNVLLISLFITLVSLFIGFYYFCVKSECNACKG
jgi:hypothetical protein